jgi:branched-chain amino acid aminotransferase
MRNQPTSWNRTPNPAPVDLETRHAQLCDPGFGRYFTDHMAAISYSDGSWHDAKLVAHAPLALDPASSGLHYGQAIFEGLKAYRQPDGDVAFFRIGDHARRFHQSATRMAMPTLPTDLFIEACTELVTADQAWVPEQPGHSLYVRPFMLATTPRLGVQPAAEYLFVVIASPAATYFPDNADAWSIIAAPDQVRAALGGTGSAKCAGNYGASLLAKGDASAAGIDEVLWLDAAEHCWVEELSAMNVFVVEEHANAQPQLVTPPASNTILDGITRRSILELAPQLGFAVREEPIALEQWRTGAARGVIREAFASGTAAVVAPIGRVYDGDDHWLIGDGTPGPVARRLRAALLDLQEGHASDPFAWRVPLGLMEYAIR